MSVVHDSSGRRVMMYSVGVGLAISGLFWLGVWVLAALMLHHPTP